MTTKIQTEEKETLVGTVYTIAMKKKNSPHWVYARPFGDNQITFQTWNGWTTPAQFTSEKEAVDWWNSNKNEVDMTEFAKFYDINTLCIKERVVTEKIYRKLEE